MGIRDLKPKELETMQLVANGVTNKGICEELFLSERAVEKRMNQILWKVTGLTADTARERRVHRRVMAAVEYQVWAARYPSLVPTRRGTHQT